jgi:hypothetical protein
MFRHARTRRGSLRGLLPASLAVAYLLLPYAAHTQTQSPARQAGPATSAAAPQSAQGGAAQQQQPAATGAAPAPAATTPVPDVTEVVRVTKVYNMTYLGMPHTDPEYVERQRAGLNEIIIVEVTNLEALLRRAKCMPPYDQPKPCREQEISLYINGRPIRGLRPESGAPTLADPTPTPAATPAPSATATTAPTPTPVPCGTAESPSACRDGKLRYHLQRVTDAANSADNQEHWADLLGFNSDYGDWDDLERPVEVSVGLADGYPLGTDVKATKPCTPEGGGFCLTRVRAWRLMIWALLALLCLGFLFWLTRRHDLLCDRRPVLWGKKRPYSLSAVQAAWWFVLVVFSFVFIWMVTGQQDLSSTALILVSIGLGTALGATVIDAGKAGADSDSGGTQAALNALLSQKQQLEGELNALVNAGAGQAELDAKKAKYQKVVGEIRRLFPNVIGPAREGFIFDILSDDNGVSFHRFQMFVWTIVLGIFFVISALGTLAMPDFSTTLLGLMGISAGTYLGFKIPEKTGSTDPHADGGEAAGVGGNGDSAAPSPPSDPTAAPTSPTPPAPTTPPAPAPPAPPAPPAAAADVGRVVADGGSVVDAGAADVGDAGAGDADATADAGVRADEVAEDDAAGGGGVQADPEVDEATSEDAQGAK